MSNNNKRIQNLVLILFVIACVLNPAFGQSKLSKEEVAQYQAEVTQMVSFLKFTMNILGDPNVSAKEKDVIINESYLKAFKDSKVQIEDDLVKTRDVVTNKDVQAYLKDVDFFFKHVKFEFNITDIANDVTPDGKLFFTVKMMRNLNGVTVENDSINTNQERYIEVNVDEENKDLRIASIYTTRLSRNDELTIWWTDLSEEWRAMLGLDIEVKPGLLLSEIQEFSDSTYVVDDQLVIDTINIIDFVKIAAGKKEIKLAGSKIITDLKPLDQLKNLIRLDISSSDITDLFPIRNLTTMEFLDCSNTMVEDLTPLKYSKSLKELYISNTPISSITVVENFENLETLDLEHTVIDSLPPIEKLTHLINLNCASTNLDQLEIIKQLKSLVNLNISNTSIEDASSLSSLKKLQELNLSHTNVNTIPDWSGLSELKTLTIEHTDITDLMPLQKLKALSTIHADYSKVTIDQFIDFSSLRPDVSLTFMSDELMDFWNNLTPEWREVLEPKLNLGDTISPEALHQILKINEIDISKNEHITTLDPLKYMPFLHQLNFSETGVADLSPIAKMTRIEILDGAKSNVSDLSPIKNLISLRKINFEQTTVNDISPLKGLKNLDSLFFSTTKVRDLSVLNLLKEFKIAYFDYSQVTDDDVYNLDFSEETSIVVYKTDRLRSWWGNMDDAWQNVFRDTEKLDDRPTTEQLHKIASKKSLKVNSTSLKTLDPIPEFVRLESLSFADTRISSLSPVSSLKKIKELRCPGNPISDVSPLSGLKTLEVLDLDNTQVDDLKPIQSLTELQELKFSGTNVKDVSPVERLTNLEVLEFAKTRVKQVNDLTGLQKLKVLKCYNNKISPKKIEDFKLSNPGCEVVFY